MNIKRAKEEIKHTIEAYLARDERGAYAIPAMRQRPILLMGPPGIGKTQIMEQVARECQIGLVAYTITHHTRQSAIGLPFITERVYGGEKKSVTEYTMSEIVASVYEKMEETGLFEGILFIDEINCVSETLAPTMLQFLQYKTFGNHKIPDGWVIVTAGNPPEYNKSVRDFDIATLDRVKRIDVEADFGVWKEYARQVAIHPAILSYLSAKPQYFYQIETTVDGKIFATPRGWEDLSRFLEVYETIGRDMDREVAGQYIQHPKIAKDFANYLELYRKYQSDYQIDAVLDGKLDGRLADQVGRAPFDEKLSVISLLLSRLETGFRAVRRKEDYLELLLGQLKEWKARLRDEAEAGTIGVRDEAGTETNIGRGEAEAKASAAHALRIGPLLTLETVACEFAADHERKKRAKLLSREDEYRYQDVEETLNRYIQAGKTGGDHGGPEGWLAFISGLFQKERGNYETLCAEASAMLEYAFDFMEAAFGDSQEMVIFVTELNAGYDSLRFLQQNECERYYQYNKKLLFEDREAGLQSRLNRLDNI